MVVLALAPLCMAARALTAIVAAADIETMSSRIGSSWVFRAVTTTIGRAARPALP